MIPIVFTHYGDSDYLEMVFRLAKKFNPGTDIYLLGDVTNTRYAKIDIKHEMYKSYQNGDLFNKFLGYYQCLSNIKNDKKVTFDFYRWFILYNFMVAKNIEKCWYFDSDTFICCNLSTKAEIFKDTPLALANHISGCIFLTNSQRALLKYLELAINLFRDKKFMAEQKKILEDHEAKNELYSCCDMTIFREYQKIYGPCGEFSDIIYDENGINGESFDPNINIDRANIIEDGPVWKMETISLGSKRPIKDIVFLDNMPYCYHLLSDNYVRINTLNMSWIPYSYMEKIFNAIMEG